MAEPLLALRRAMEPVVAHRSAADAPAMRAIAPGAEAMDLQTLVQAFSSAKKERKAR